MNKGFTLIELMIVVAIIGILAAVAIPSFMRYIKDSKTTEAKENLAAIVTGATQYFQAEHCFDTACMAPTNQLYPGEPAAEAYAIASTNITIKRASGIGQKQSPSASDVTTALGAAPWTDLKFSINKPFYYSYSYVSDGTTPGGSTFSAGAEASLNSSADSKFFVSGTADGKVGNIVSPDDGATMPTELAFAASTSA